MVSNYEKLPKPTGKRIYKTKYKCQKCGAGFAIDKSIREPKKCPKCGFDVFFYDPVY